MLRDIAGLFKAAAVNWVSDYAQSMGAALAFYTMFSIAPLLLIVISVAGIAFGEEAARGEIFGQLQYLLGAPGALAVQSLLESAGTPADSVPAAVLGIVLLIVGATSVFAELQDALDRIWKAPATPASSGLLRVLRVRLLSFCMILGVGFLLMASLLFSAAHAAVARSWGPMFGEWNSIAQSFDVALGVVLSMLVFGLVFKTMPRVAVAWKDVWVGAAVTSALFVAGKFLIGAYLRVSGVSSLFGAAASFVVVLLWVYYSAQIFLYGAEFTMVYSHRFGSRKGRPVPVAGQPLPTMPR